MRALIGVLIVLAAVLALGPIATELVAARTASGVSSSLSGAFDGGIVLVGLLTIMTALALVLSVFRR